VQIKESENTVQSVFYLTNLSCHVFSLSVTCCLYHTKRSVTLMCLSWESVCTSGSYG